MELSEHRQGSLLVAIDAEGTLQLTRCQARRAMVSLTPEEAELLHRLLDASRRLRCPNAPEEAGHAGSP